MGNKQGEPDKFLAYCFESFQASALGWDTEAEHSKLLVLRRTKFPGKPRELDSVGWSLTKERSV